jgi:hypothetical protein
MFGFIKRITKALDEIDEPLTEEGKLRLMRRLLRERMQRNPVAVAAIQAEGLDLYNLPAATVIGCPDALVVTIVMNYIDGKRDGLEDEQLLRSIHSRFSSTFVAAHTPFPFGPLPSPLTLRTLVRYYIDSQHGHAAPISDEVMDYEIQQAFKWYDR